MDQVIEVLILLYQRQICVRIERQVGVIIQGQMEYGIGVVLELMDERLIYVLQQN